MLPEPEVPARAGVGGADDGLEPLGLKTRKPRVPRPTTAATPPPATAPTIHFRLGVAGTAIAGCCTNTGGCACRSRIKSRS